MLESLFTSQLSPFPVTHMVDYDDGTSIKIVIDPHGLVTEYAEYKDKKFHGVFRHWNKQGNTTLTYVDDVLKVSKLIQNNRSIKLTNYVGEKSTEMVIMDNELTSISDHLGEDKHGVNIRFSSIYVTNIEYDRGTISGAYYDLCARTLELTECWFVKNNIAYGAAIEEDRGIVGITYCAADIEVTTEIENDFGVADPNESVLLDLKLRYGPDFLSLSEYMPADILRRFFKKHKLQEYV